MKNEVCETCGHEYRWHFEKDNLPSGRKGCARPIAANPLTYCDCESYRPTTKSIEATSPVEGGELLACPFCGSADWVLSVSDSDNWKTTVECRGCFARGPLHRTDPAAKEGWNTRTSTHTERLEAERDRLKNAVQIYRKAAILIEQGTTSESASKLAASAQFMADAALASAALPESEPDTDEKTLLNKTR